MATQEELDEIAGQSNAPVAQIQAPQAGLDAIAALNSGAQVAPLPQTSPTGPDATPVSFDPASTPSQSTDLPGGVPVVPAQQVDRGKTLSIPGVDTQAMEQARQAGLDAAQAKSNETPAIAEKEEAAAEGHDKVAQQERDNAVDLQAEDQYQKDGLAEARRIADEANEEVKNHKFHNYFENTTTSQKILTGLGFLLGTFGHALQARTNPNAKNMALEAIDANIQKDFDQQKAELATKENFAKYKERGVTDLQAQYKEDLSKIQMKQALATKAVAAEAQAILLRKGVPLAEAENNTVVQQFRAKADEDYSKSYNEAIEDKAQLALEKARLGATYATIGETRREHEQNDQLRRDALDERAREADERNAAKSDAKKVADQARDEATEIRDVDGNVIGHAPTIGTRLNPEIAHADNRVGNAKALISTFEELKTDVANNGNNLVPGTVKYRNRERLIANAQAAKRVAEQLPASEGGIHLEEKQMPGSGSLFGFSTSPELIDNTIKGIREKVNQQNAAIVHDRKSAPISATNDITSAEKIKSIKDPGERSNAIEATAALSDPKKAARARAYLAKKGLL